jgi:hypothetical protein
MDGPCLGTVELSPRIDCRCSAFYTNPKERDPRKTFQILLNTQPGGLLIRVKAMDFFVDDAGSLCLRDEGMRCLSAWAAGQWQQIRDLECEFEVQ